MTLSGCVIFCLVFLSAFLPAFAAYKAGMAWSGAYDRDPYAEACGLLTDEQIRELP